MTSTFSDRFIFDAPISPPSEDIASATDTQLYVFFPRLRDMVEMVRRHSVLLKKKTAAEIYFCITDHADPSIGLRIAAARDKAGNLIFPGIETVKQVMFGPTDSDTTYTNANLNLFVDGVRGASAKLAAAILIGQLATIREQEIHSKALEKLAYEDIDRLLQVPDIALIEERVTASTDSNAFYFESLEMELASALQVDVFMPALANVGSMWQNVGTYSGTTFVSSIVSDIGDTINQLTLNSSYSNLLAAPVLASSRVGGNAIHQIQFHSRFRDAAIAAEVVTVRIRYLAPNASQPLPFKWGMEENKLEPFSVNSLIVTVQTASTTAVAAGRQDAAFNPTVLWFRQAPRNPISGEVLDDQGNIMPNASWQSADLNFRISPTMTEGVIVPVPYVVGEDEGRPGALALQLLNEMFAIKAATRALGAIIRNDTPGSLEGLTAVELVAFSATNPETWMILDLLDFPKDIQVAVGDTQRPLTPFSSRPRSIRVESRYDFRVNQDAIVNASGGGSDGRMLKLLPSPKLGVIQDKLRRLRGEI